MHSKIESEPWNKKGKGGNFQHNRIKELKWTIHNILLVIHYKLRGLALFSHSISLNFVHFTPFLTLIVSQNLITATLLFANYNWIIKRALEKQWELNGNFAICSFSLDWTLGIEIVYSTC